MSFAEILDRVGDARRRRAWRRRMIGWPGHVADGPLMAPPGLRIRLAAAASLAPVERSLALLEAGSPSFLGKTWPPFDGGDDTGFWFHDPIGLRSWPGAGTSSFVVDVRSTSSDPCAGDGFGDVKFVWEPNRLQMLHPLAAALAGGKAEAEVTAFTILRGWAEANPPYAGVNWVSGIEMALRIVGVTLLCAASAPERWAVEDRIFLRRFVTAHADYLLAFPSHHSSANNHLIAEGLGLLLAGLLMPDHPTWATQGRRILEAESERQILADGVGAEQSPTYQAFTMEMLALAVLVCRESGSPLAPIVTTRLIAGAGFLRALMDTDGGIPAIGDDDEGRVIGQPPDREPRYVASIVATVAGLTGRPDLMPPAHEPHLRDGLFGVRSPPCPLPIGRRTFGVGGYTTARERVAGRTATLVFDHGPLGYLTLCAHGHADALALWLAIDDRPVLVDAGTFLYFAGGDERTRLRESLAHNTLSVAGTSQSVAARGFSWISRAAARLRREEVHPAWSVTAWHDGYERRFGVRHERRLGRLPEGYVIEDRLVGSRSPLPSDISFMVSPALTLTREADTVLVTSGDDALCRLTGPRMWTSSIESRHYAPRFGELASTQAIVFSGVAGAEGVSTRIEILATS